MRNPTCHLALEADGFNHRKLVPYDETRPRKRWCAKSRIRRAFLALTATLSGCTSVLGIDDDYVLLESSQNGGRSTMAMGGQGGQAPSTSSGGVAVVGGASAGGQHSQDASPSDAAAEARVDANPPDTGADADAVLCGSSGAACGPGTKCCSGQCVTPQPLVGCNLDLCDPCPEPPAEAIAVCVLNRCAIACNFGYKEENGACVPDETGTGGTSGDSGTATGGSGGSTGCEDCRGCGPVGPIGCCRNNGTCGCTWAPGAYCL